MRFLVDANVSPRLATALRSAGHDALHVREILPLTATDTAIFDRAAADSRTVISADSDFGELLARRGTARPSLVLLRTTSRRRVEQLTALILAELADVERDLEQGAVAVIEDTRVRVRRLPIHPPHD